MLGKLAISAAGSPDARLRPRRTGRPAAGKGLGRMRAECPPIRHWKRHMTTIKKARLGILACALALHVLWHLRIECGRGRPIADGQAALKRGDYATALKLLLPKPKPGKPPRSAARLDVQRGYGVRQSEIDAVAGTERLPTQAVLAGVSTSAYVCRWARRQPRLWRGIETFSKGHRSR